MKTCKICRETKEINLFPFRNDVKKYRPLCMECYDRICKEKKNARIDEYKKNRKEYYLKNVGILIIYSLYGQKKILEKVIGI